VLESVAVAQAGQKSLFVNRWSAHPGCSFSGMSGRTSDQTLWSNSHVRNHARNAGSRCPLWSPNPLLEPEDGPFIFGHRNKIHIINLEKTLPMFQDALKYVRQLAANRGTILSWVPSVKRAKSWLKKLARWHALRRPALAGRHADQLQDRQDLDQAPEGHGSRQGSRRWKP
jgi:hypothetical protein